MLVKADRKLLGDAFLKGAESVARFREGNRARVDAARRPDEHLLVNKEAAQGSTLSPTDFLLKLQRLNNALLFKTATVWKRPTIAVYHMKWDDDEGTIVPKYITGCFLDAPLPEYTTLTDPNELGIFTRTNRGWREILVDCIKVRAITKREAEKTFKKPTGIRAIGAWDAQLQKFNT